ncbi:MAG: phosphoribosylformimino-5-aminoimidazole carboxamide ribotide isomerase [Spirochaetes bacterium]|nr:phosphoribosylformimino-5-aminoimidazole carboxamide ribotide isomerase [Spirochaetota bacterium]
MRFRPCIDLHNGKVVQIVGGTLKGDCPDVNFETEKSPEDFAMLYAQDNLYGGHVISLGSGNYDAALSALKAFPGGLHMGGGINPDNAKTFLDAGASHVIVTSYVFTNGIINFSRLDSLIKTVGKTRLVLDLSCRKKENEFMIVTDRWQKFTDVQISHENLLRLSDYCDEFLVHGVDVEGKMTGIDSELVSLLAEHSPIPTTYAGGVKSMNDLDLIKDIGKNIIDITIGSALDIFGGSIPYKSVVEWHKKNI